MKKWVAGLVFISLLGIAVPVGSASVTMYAPDGRTTVVAPEDVEAYAAVGWYKTYEETVCTVYAMDGRELVIPRAYFAEYLAVGWYATRTETVCTVYAMDGRELEIPRAYLAEYLAVGWYATRAETVCTVYALDGREFEIPRAYLTDYLAVGWYATREETVQNVFAADGRVKSIFKSEVPAYLAVGWRITPFGAPKIALTFDDGPHGTHTDAILKTLRKHGAKATFFMLGTQVDMYPSIAARVAAAGHEIGSHTYIHPNLSKVGAARVQSELSKTNAAILRATGKKPTLLRPPYGSHTATVRKMAGVPLVLWNVDTVDWQSKNADAIVRHVLENARDGAIILLHDIYGSTAEAVEKLVPALRLQGFQLVTVSELAAAKGKTLSPGNAYHGF